MQARHDLIHVLVHIAVEHVRALHGLRRVQFSRVPGPGLWAVPAMQGRRGRPPELRIGNPELHKVFACVGRTLKRCIARIYLKAEMSIRSHWGWGGVGRRGRGEHFRIVKRSPNVRHLGLLLLAMMFALHIPEPSASCAHVTFCARSDGQNGRCSVCVPGAYKVSEDDLFCRSCRPINNCNVRFNCTAETKDATSDTCPLGACVDGAFNNAENAQYVGVSILITNWTRDDAALVFWHVEKKSFTCFKQHIPVSNNISIVQQGVGHGRI